MGLASTTLKIAGVRIRLRGAARSIRRAARRYSPYVVEGSADVTLDWREGVPPRSSRWPNPSVLNGKGDRVVLSRRDFHGEMTGGKGRFITEPKLISLDSFLRVLMTEVLAGKGGLLVHSAAIGNRLFPGRSDAGKSTLSSLAPKGRVLSDEIVAVLPTRRGFDLCATPFWGSFRRGTSTDRKALRTIFFLHRRKRERIDRIDSAEALTRLLECVLCFRDDHARGARLLEIAGKVVSSVPTFTLSYDAFSTRFAELEDRLVRAE